MSETENAVAAEKAPETIETQNTEEVKEVVEDKVPPATEKSIEESAAVDETPAAPPEEEHEISYHAVEKEGSVTAIWEMQGPKHIRTIDPRSNEGKKILSLFETAV